MIDLLLDDPVRFAVSFVAVLLTMLVIARREDRR